MISTHGNRFCPLGYRIFGLAMLVMAAWIPMAGCRTKGSSVIKAVTPTTQATSLWQPIEITHPVQIETFVIPSGKYFIFPVIEPQDDGSSVSEILISVRSGVEPQSVDRATGKTSDGVMAVFIPILGRATLRTQFTGHQVRFSLNPQIGTIWFGLAHTNQEWCSMPLKRMLGSEQK
ncbi:MAG: hypothetical protein HY774_03850 [Acidobacteria bacterium]|nr:hypothetical protein [Acidobacteriota bacterium]